MGRRVIISLLLAGVLAVWQTEANAFNRINGILIKHSDLEVEVSLSGVPSADTLVKIVLGVTVQFLCVNPQQRETNPGTPEKQDFTFTTTDRVTSADFTNGKFVLVRIFDISAVECHQNNFIKVPNSELAISVSTTTAWLQCIGKEPGVDGINDGDKCFEFGGTVETVKSKPIEVLQTECAAGVRNPDGTVPHQELPCESTVVS